jgi:hypothetical protein
MTRPIPPSPPDECRLVSPALASIRSGFTPFELRNLLTHFDPILDDGPVVRTVHVGGRLLIRLDDVLLAAHALAEGRSAP